jgi:hypothetical protein
MIRDRITDARNRSVRLLWVSLATVACAANAGREIRALGPPPNYPNFSSTAGLTLVGNAAQAGNRLQLTPAESSKVGGAWFTEKQFVADGFKTSFAFEVSQPDPNFGADGFVFIVQNVSPTALGQGGSSLGFMDIGVGPGLDNFLGVEFDTHNSGITFDTNGNHIAVQSKSPGQARAFLASANPPFAIQGGGVHTAQISYDPGVLKIAVDGSRTNLLQVNVNLSSLLGLTDGLAWVGFTGATGGAWEKHDLLNWTFTAVPEPSALLLLLAAPLLVFIRRR